MFSLREQINAVSKKQQLCAEALQFFIALSVLIVATQIRITLPFTPVPISFQLMTALLVGVAFGARRGFFYTISYVVLITCVTPSLGSSQMGFSFASFGYLAAMPFAAAFCGYMHQIFKGKSILLRSIPLYMGTVLVYAMGLPWLAMFVGWSNVLEFGVYPFIALDLARATLAGTILMVFTSKK